MTESPAKEFSKSDLVFQLTMALAILRSEGPEGCDVAICTMVKDLGFSDKFFNISMDVSIEGGKSFTVGFFGSAIETAALQVRLKGHAERISPESLSEEEYTAIRRCVKEGYRQCVSGEIKPGEEGTITGVLTQEKKIPDFKVTVPTNKNIH